MSSASRSSKRQRTDINPYVDLEATVGEEDQESEIEEQEEEGFIVDENDHTLERDVLRHHLAGNSNGMFSRDENEEEETWNGLLERARMRAMQSDAGSPEIAVQTSPSLVDTSDTIPAQAWVRLLWDTSNQQESVFWVRMRPARGKYKEYVGDLGVAMNVRDSSDVMYLLVPRLLMEELPKGEKRPASTLFNESVVRALCGESSIKRVRKGIAEFRFRGDLFTAQGFLIIYGSSDIAASFQGQLTPTPEEFEPFKHCNDLPWYFRAQTSFKITQNAIELGDRVKCIDGELRGLIGVVRDIAEDSLVVDLPALDITHLAMKWEVRKFFVIGDPVLASSGHNGGRRGWVVQAKDDEITVMDFDKEEEVICSWKELKFDDEERRFFTLRNLNTGSRMSWKDKNAMKQNSNAQYVGKEVMVVGTNHFKGSTGTIKDTTIDGHAFVSLNIFNHRHAEKFHFKSLRIVKGRHLEEIVTESHATPELARWRHPSLEHPTPIPTPLHDVSEDPSSRTPGNITPMPTPVSGAVSSAWDPSSGTPVSTLLQSPSWNSTFEASSSHHTLDLASENEETEGIPDWLADHRLQGYRFKLRIRGMPSHKFFEIKSMTENIVTVRDGLTTIQVPLSNILPYRPQRREDVVVCVAVGDLYGQKFRLKSVNPQECVLRKYGVKIQKNEKLFTVPTSSLVVIYPSTATNI